MDATVLFYCFAKDLSVSQTEKLIPSIAHTSVVRFYKKMRSILNTTMQSLKFMEMVDGMQDIVEIDESLFGKKRKYNKGNITKRYWIFGMAQRNSRKTYFTPVLSRDHDTLLEIIKEKVEEGSLIYHDDWKSYTTLPEHGYKHGVVVHSKEFVSEEGVCTNTIEGISQVTIAI